MSVNDQLNEYKINIKNEIKNLVNTGKLDEASAIINEYEQVIKEDVEIASIKSIIFMLDGKMEEAERLLWQGISIDSNNPDLLYNLAYLHESIGEHSTAFRLYTHASQNADDPDLKKEVEAALRNLEVNIKDEQQKRMKRFIVLSSSNWESAIERSSQIALALCKLGYRVDYINTTRESTAAASADVSMDDAVTYSENSARQSGLVRILTPITFHYNNNTMGENYKELVQRIINKSVEQVVLVCYSAADITVINELRGEFQVIFECLNDYSDMDYPYWKYEAGREFERLMFNRADAVTTIAAADYLAKTLKRNNIYLAEYGIQEIKVTSTEETWKAASLQLLDLLHNKTKPYVKEAVIPRIRNNYEERLAIENSPLLRSEYSLTFAEVDTAQFLAHAEKAYKDLKSAYTLKNYIFAAYVNGEVDTCIHAIIEDPDVERVYKAELMFLKEHYNGQQLRQIYSIKLLHLAKRYDFICDEIDKLEGLVRKAEQGHYYYAIADRKQAEVFYTEVLQHDTKLQNSPLLNKNLAGIYVEAGDFARGQLFRDKKNEFTRRYSNTVDINPRPKFSIVIPTRNSPNTLEHTLQTCLKQQFDSYEVVLSDNSSNDLTKQMIDRLADSKIKYVRPQQELAMAENFNYAISKISGEYVIVLGSDDGLLLHSLSMLDCILDALETKVIHWNYISYCWPDVTMDGYGNYLSIPPVIPGQSLYKELDSIQIMRAVAAFQMSHTALPMLYCNAVIHRDMLVQLAGKTGNVFNGSIPDVYSGFVAAYLKKIYVSLNIPMSIGGSSGNSNGIAYHHGKKDQKSQEIKEDFLKLNNKAGYKRDSIIPNVKSVESAIADSFINAKKLFFPDDGQVVLDRKKMIQKCADGLIRTDSSFEKDLQKLYDSLSDSPELQGWFKANYLENTAAVGREKKTSSSFARGFTSGGMLQLNALDFGVTDVYGAAELYRKITGL